MGAGLVRLSLTHCTRITITSPDSVFKQADRTGTIVLQNDNSVLIMCWIFLYWLLIIDSALRIDSSVCVAFDNQSCPYLRGFLVQTLEMNRFSVSKSPKMHKKICVKNLKRMHKNTPNFNGEPQKSKFPQTFVATQPCVRFTSTLNAVHHWVDTLMQRYTRLILIDSFIHSLIDWLIDWLICVEWPQSQTSWT